MRIAFMFPRFSLAVGLALGLASLASAATNKPAGWPNGYVYRDYPASFAMPQQSNTDFALHFKAGLVDFSRIPLKDATFVRVFGNGKHKIAMFADANCKETQDWEKWANKNLKDATVYTFAIPLIHGNDDSFSQQFVCRASNNDRAHAWEQWLFTGKKPAAIPNCHSPLPMDFANGLRKPNQKALAGGKVYKLGYLSPFFISDTGRLAIGAATGSPFYTLYKP